MANKLKRRAVRKATPASPVRRTLERKLPGHISPDEVISLEHQAAQHQKSELSWLSMTAAPPADENDRWSAVEEHLLSRSREQDHSARRWKYFAK